MGKLLLRSVLLPQVNRSTPSRSKGSLTICGEEIKNSNALITFQFSAVDLDKKDTFGKSDPFFKLSRVSEDGSR
jgi:hypothetical protein